MLKKPSFKKIKESFGITPDPAYKTDFIPELILNICEDTSESYEDIYINKDLFVKLICLSKRGVFFFIPCKDAINLSYAKQKVNTIRTMFGLSFGNSFFFFVWDNEGVLYSEKELMAGDIYKNFNNLYDNLSDPEVVSDDIKLILSGCVKVTSEKISKLFTHDGVLFSMDDDDEDTVKEDKPLKNRVDDKTCERLDVLFTRLAGNSRPDPNVKTKIDEDGNEWVKKYEAKTIAGFDLGLVGKEKWFPVSDMNTDSLVIKAGIFGFLGINRFTLGQFLTGLLYVLTCGCLGILPLFDIVGYLLGNTYYTVNDYSPDGKTKTSQRFYLRKPKNKKLAVIMLILSVVISFLVFKFVYMNIFSLIGNLASNNMSEQTINTFFSFQ